MTTKMLFIGLFASVFKGHCKNKLYFKLQTEIRNSFKIPWNFFVYLSISGCQVSLTGIISGVPID